MEKEGLIRAVKKLQEYGLGIDIMVTDRHRQIAKWIGQFLPHIKHYYDVWLLAKVKLGEVHYTSLYVKLS